MRANWVLLLALALPIGCADAPDHADLASLVAKHTEARGGVDAIERVEAFESDLRIEEPTFAVDGRYVATRDGRMRIDVSMDGTRVFTEALDHGRSRSSSSACMR